MKSVNQIVTCVCEEVKLYIEEELESKGCHHINLSEVFRPINIFEGLETEYQQTQFYKEHFRLVVRFIWMIFMLAFSIATFRNL